MKDFALKFVDIMIGIVLGLGFQWWPNLAEPRHYVAFFFAYLTIIDYWIDYSPALKKYPPKNEVDLMADIGLLFSMFLLIYSAQLTVLYFLVVFGVYRILDFIWMGRIRHDYALQPHDKIFFDTWLKFELVELLVTLILIAVSVFLAVTPLTILIIFVIFRVIMRVLASFQYKKVHFA